MPEVFGPVKSMSGGWELGWTRELPTYFSATAGYCQAEVRKGVARHPDILIFKFLLHLKNKQINNNKNLVDPTKAG